MHTLLDDYAQSNALRDTNPRLKLLLGLGAILICTSSAAPIAPLFIAVTMNLITVILARIPARLYSRLLIVPLSFALLSAIVVAFMHGTGVQLFAQNVLGYKLVIMEDGANLALLLIARTLGGMCSLFFIALTTPMIEVFSVLKSLRVPQAVIELSMMIYRYIFVLLDQAVMINNAQAMRLGHAGLKASLNSFSMLASVLFLRAWEQGERLVVAMDSRCYDGHLDAMEKKVSQRPQSTLAVAGYLATVAVIAFFTRDMRLI